MECKLTLLVILVVLATSCTVVIEKPVVQTVVVEKEVTVEKPVVPEVVVIETVVVEKEVLVAPTSTPAPTLTPTPTLTPAPPDTPTPAPTLTPTSTPSMYVPFPLAFEQRPTEMPLSWHFWERLVVFESPNIIRLEGRPLSLYPELLTMEEEQPFWIRDERGFRLATEEDIGQSGMVLNWYTFVYIDLCWPGVEELPEGEEIEVKSVALLGSGSLARDKYTPEKWEVILFFSGREYKVRFMMYCFEPCRPSLLGDCEVYRPLDYRDEGRGGRIVYHENHDTPFVEFDEPVPVESLD